MKRAVPLALLCLLLVLVLLTAAPAFAFVSTGDGGWFWQNPRPQGNNLNDVTFVDASQGWAVGDFGTILHTSDGGASWTAQRSGTTEDLCDVSFPDAVHGWVVGSAWEPQTSSYTSVILATADGGVTWTEQRSSIGESFSGVSFPDASHGWAVGFSYDRQTFKKTGVILATSDGGATWTAQSPGTLPEVYELDAVSVLDARHGWVVGLSRRSGGYWPVILATTDGGSTWLEQYCRPGPELWDICFPDASHGWAVGGDTIVATADGGATWTEQRSSAGEDFSAVCFPDASHGWAVGASYDRLTVSEKGLILATSDGGATWTEQRSSVGEGFFSGVSFPDASHGWVVSNNGTSLATADGGATWTAQSSDTRPDVQGISFPDASHGWAVGYDNLATWPRTQAPVILATADGGATWTAQDSGTRQPLNSVCFPDASHGWVVGSSYDPQTSSYTGVILATSDGGATWTEQRSGTEWLTSVCFPDASHGWVVGGGWDRQTSSYTGVILATADGGVTWTRQHSGANVLGGVSFLDAAHGWVVGNHGTILATADGGATWTAQNSGTRLDLKGISFPDASHGWAVGESHVQNEDSTWSYTSVILATADAGVTWTEQRSRVGEAFFGVSFTDASHGWAVGGNETILATYDGYVTAGPPYASVILATADGGATWTAQDSGSGNWFFGVDFPDASHGWVVGDSGTILATTNGGWPDCTPPTTTISGADGLWHNTDVSLTLAGSDNPGGSGVDVTSYQIDGGPWLEGTNLTLPAPADHTGDGLHTVSYYSTDFSGNIEATQSVAVKIDTTPPVISVAYLTHLHHGRQAAEVQHGSRLSLTYRIDDNMSPTVAVTMELVSSKGKVLQTVSLGQRPAGVLHVYQLPRKQPRGFWRWRLTATDLAGNTEGRMVGWRSSVHH